MPTTNPVPSADPTDLLFNAGKLDEVVNGAANSFTDRFGVARRTVAGMNADFDAQLADAESDLNVYRSDAAASAAEALGYLQTIRATSYGAYAEDPTTDPLGNPPTVGDEYFNTTANLLKRWNGTTWQASDINTANLAAPGGSSLVGYQPTGTGAVATTVQSKLREMVSVFDFMTTAQIADVKAGTTSIDVTAPINAAIASAKDVYFPEGKYRVTTLVVPNSGTTLRGCGASSHIYSTATTNAIDLTSVNDVTIKELKVEGVYSNTSVKSISITNCNDVTIARCTIENFGSAGIFTPQGSVCNRLNVSHNRIVNTGDFGVHVQGGDTLAISDNFISNNDYINYPPHSIYLKYDCTNIVIANNILRDCLGANGHAIKLSGEAGGTCVNASITGNSVEGCFGGIYLYNTLDVSVTGNVIKNNIPALPTKDAQGIELFDTNTNVLISGNNIDSTLGRGVNIDGSSSNRNSNIVVSGNYVNCGSNAVYCDYSDYVQISGNTLANNSSTTSYTTTFASVTNLIVAGNIIKAGLRHVMASLCSYASFVGNILIDNPSTPVPDYAIRVDSTCSDVVVQGNSARQLTNGYISSSATYQSVLGNIGSSANESDRAMTIGTAAPIAGTWRVGDVVRNRAPAEAGTAGSKYVITGWVCTAAGTPGTWTTMRSLTGN